MPDNTVFTPDAQSQKLISTGVAPEAVEEFQKDRGVLAQKQANEKLEADLTALGFQPATEQEAQRALQAPKQVGDPAAEMEAQGFKEADPLDLFSDDQLSKDKTFEPLQYYVAHGGAEKLPFSKLQRAAKILRAQEINWNPVPTVAGTLKAAKAVPRLFYGIGSGIAAGANAILSPLAEMGLSAVGQTDLALELQKQSLRTTTEAASGAVADVSGLGEGVKTLGGKLGRWTHLQKSWKEMSDDDALKVLVDWGEHSRELERMAGGEVEAFKPLAESLAKEGVPIRPEEVEKYAAGGPASWLAFGAGISAGKALVTGTVKAGVRAAVPAIEAGEKAAQTGRMLELATAAEKATGEQAARSLEQSAQLASGGAVTVPLAENVVGAARAGWETAQKVLGVAEKNFVEAQSAFEAARGSGLSKAVLDASEVLQKVKIARTTATAAADALKAGPQNLEREAASRSAILDLRLAESALKENNLAGAYAFFQKAGAGLAEGLGTAAQKAAGWPVEAVGWLTKKAGGLAQQVGKPAANIIPIAGLFTGQFSIPGAIAAYATGKLAGPAIKAVGERVQRFGKTLAGEIPPGPNAAAALDIAGAIKDTFTTAAKAYPIDYAFAQGTAKTEQEAREMAPIATAMGVIPGLHRGLTRIVKGELIRPRGQEFKPVSSPAYGENATLDKLNTQASAKMSPEARNRVNFVRELARKMGARVYVMPDQKTFASALDEIWRQQNPGRELTPEVQQRNGEAATQKGYTVSNFIGPDGRPQTVAFIRDPASLGHEAGHLLENILGEDTNAKLDEATRVNISDAELNQFAQNYSDLLTNQSGIPWQEAIVPYLPSEMSAETYMLREMRSEAYDALLHNQRQDITTPPNLYRSLVSFLARVAEKAGVPMITGVSDLGAPISAEMLAKSGKATREFLSNEPEQELIRARDARLREAAIQKKGVTPEKAPVTPEATPESNPREKEAAKIEEYKATVRDPSRNEVLQKLADAVRTGTPVKVDYHTAPGEPAGSPKMSRDQRRAVVEAFRDMPNEARPLWEKVNLPDRVEVTSKGLQLLGWSPENYAANAHRIAKWASERPEAANLIPYPLDPQTGSFTVEGWKQLYEDSQVFVRNQQAGGTGSGKPLTVPENLNIHVPALDESKLQPLAQEVADFHNVLFNVMLPETPRVMVHGGKPMTPGNIKGQEIAKANEPLIGPRITEPGRPRSKQEFKGFPGRTIQEVNPLRAQFEKIGDFPKLIEVNQRLNFEHIADVNPAPEASNIRGVTDTLRGGFKPGDKREWKVSGQRQGQRKEITVQAADLAEARRLGEAQGMRVERVAPTGSVMLNTGAFKPGLPTREQVRDASNEEWRNMWNSRRGGFTQAAYDMAANAKSLDDLRGWREAMEEHKVRFAEAVKNGDLDGGMTEATKGQFYREAIEAATNTGSARGVIEKPAFEGAQFKPKAEDKQRALDLDFTSQHLQDRLQVGEDISFGQFKPATNAGRELEKKGFTFDGYGLPGSGDYMVSVAKNGQRVGDIHAITTDGKSAKVGVVTVDKRYQKQGVGEALYRELASRLQADGIKQLTGDVVSPEPLKIRRKVFGEGNTTIESVDEGRPIGEKEAGDFIRAKRAAREPFLIEAASDIRPDAQYRPREEGERVLPFRQPRVGLEFKDFFSQVTKGTFGKSDKPFEPTLDLDGEREFVASKAQHSGNFDDHIAKSIPTFYEAQVRKGNAIIKTYGSDGAKVLDIAASEGSFDKAVSELSSGKVETVSLDPNPDMAKFFRDKSEVPGASYVEEAFLNGFEDSGKTYPAYSPKDRFDVINESMGFQFIDGDRRPQLAETKRLLKPDGVFLTEEKVKNPDWAANERLKDTQHKNKYFSTDELKAKDEKVGFTQSKQETKAVGMVDNMATAEGLEGALRDNFKYVVQYWDSGNFKGYAAGDDFANVMRLVSNMGDLNSDFSTVNTPRLVTGEQELAAGQFKPRAEKLKKFRPSADKTSKSWILPDGDFVPLGATWHHDYLAKNHAELNKRFGTELTENTTKGDERMLALNRGFVRLNYENNGGRLTAEANNRHWGRQQRDSLFEVALDNLDAIDNITINLLNDKGELIKEDYATLFRARTDQEKIEALPALLTGQAKPKPKEKKSPYYWIGPKGEIIPAPEGHEAAVYDNKLLPGWKPKTEDILAELYPLMEKKGYLRVTADPHLDPNELYVNGVILTVDKLSGAQRQAIEDLAFDLSRKVFYNDRETDLGPEEPRGQFKPRVTSKDEPLPGLDVGRAYNAKEIGGMNLSELKEHFPEAIVPQQHRTAAGALVPQEIPSEILKSPLYKQAGSHDEAVQKFGDKLVEFAKQYESEPAFQSGRKWYSDFTPALKKEFGKDSELFAELLAATSPNTDPTQNFSYALEAFQAYKGGKFDKMVAKFNEGFERLGDGRLEAGYKREVPAELRADNVTPKVLVDFWINKHDLIPRRENDKKFGINSSAVLQVLARRWLDMNRGPKTLNFVDNLLGRGEEATIDLWADRTMRRIGYADAKERWRILPENKSGVVEEDFNFAQDAFRNAAQKLGMKPSELQGALWYAEKKLWADNGWGRLSLGDYRKELKALELRKKQVPAIERPVNLPIRRKVDKQVELTF